ncbi:hypothetical protein ACWGQ5_49465 [Streptomyces sp. NPDC055722]
MAGPSEGIPVAHEPRTGRAPRPWVSYDGNTGRELFRYSGREYWTTPVDKDNEIAPTQTVAHSVFLRLAAEGVACE